ncbi:Zn(II)2Cys6 transcription factor [Phanerochaete sordida]|uniref:Zn(II)2Cys6 transcription factor n=1 Tax=Phanerochaete sordida TaxID=48140 RepID=A0A9P3LD11_9APHY|nr:Zn(II)2Cys6 transcription factor [Phanerochaete sordida]
MSTLHMPYDDPMLSMHLLREHDHDMALALDMRPLGFHTVPLAPFYHDDGTGYLVASSSYPEPAYDDAPTFWSTQAVAMMDDIREQEYRERELRQPVPRRPVSPEFLISHGHGMLPMPAPSQPLFEHGSFASGSYTLPPSFAPPTEAPAPADEQPPPPPPSWAMSGSLDPVTGIYQTAPEHPRVRTQQACEKCRGRKAKCSGERPCARCVTRGLHCEYAPERKMRGPNKVKRARAPAAPGAARRASIASSAATTSSEDEPPSPLTAAPRTFTMTLDVPAASATPHTAPSSPVRARARPPPISLEGTRLYDQTSVPAGAPFAFDAGAGAARRASLPAYMIAAHARAAAHGGVYTPSRGLDVIESSPRPRSSPAHPMEMLASGGFPASGSSSGATTSAPRTPSHAHDQLMYPGFAPPPSGFTPDFASLGSFDGSQWLNTDVDATPTLASDSKALGTLDPSLMDM